MVKINYDKVRDHLLYLCRKNNCHPADLKGIYNFYGKYARELNKLIFFDEES